MFFGLRAGVPVLWYCSVTSVASINLDDGEFQVAEDIADSFLLPPASQEGTGAGAGAGGGGSGASAVTIGTDDEVPRTPGVVCVVRQR